MSTFSELEAAVSRLTPAAVALRRAHLGSGSLLSYDDGCRTPDSIMSTGSSGAFSGNSNSMNWKLPDKLQVSYCIKIKNIYKKNMVGTFIDLWLNHVLKISDCETY